jgi:hypothetical protein
MLHVFDHLQNFLEKFSYKKSPTKFVGGQCSVLLSTKYVALQRREYLAKAVRIFKRPTNFVGEF